MSSTERQQVLGALERLQAKLVEREEWTHSETMGNLRETLQSPLFNHILTLQHSIKQLRNQVRNKTKKKHRQPAAQKPDQNRTSTPEKTLALKPGQNLLPPAGLGHPQLSALVRILSRKPSVTETSLK